MRWHKHDVLFHLRGGQTVRIPAFSLKVTRRNGDELTGYEIVYAWPRRRESFYVRIDSVDFIELRNRAWWRWAW